MFLTFHKRWHYYSKRKILNVSSTLLSEINWNNQITAKNNRPFCTNRSDFSRQILPVVCEISSSIIIRLFLLLHGNGVALKTRQLHKINFPKWEGKWANFRQLKFKHSFVGCFQRTLLVDWNSEHFLWDDKSNEENLFVEFQVSFAEGSNVNKENWIVSFISVYFTGLN